MNCTSDVIALARGLEHDKKNLEKSIDEIKGIWSDYRWAVNES